MDLHDQIILISKAGAYDVIATQVKELQEENEKLKEEVKFWQTSSEAFQRIATQQQKAISDYVKFSEDVFKID